eukprot:scaffold923_cov171-Amphora_coffeaeformis.AAC.3
MVQNLSLESCAGGRERSCFVELTVLSLSSAVMATRLQPRGCGMYCEGIDFSKKDKKSGFGLRSLPLVAPRVLVIGCLSSFVPLCPPSCTHVEIWYIFYGAEKLTRAESG